MVRKQHIQMNIHSTLRSDTMTVCTPIARKEGYTESASQPSISRAEPTIASASMPYALTTARRIGPREF